MKQDNEDIYVQLVGSGEPLRRTTDPAPDSSPVWSPDGTQIAFVRDKGDQSGCLRGSQPGRKREEGDRLSPSAWPGSVSGSDHFLVSRWQVAGYAGA